MGTEVAQSSAETRDWYVRVTMKTHGWLEAGPMTHAEGKQCIADTYRKIEEGAWALNTIGVGLIRREEMVCITLVHRPPVAPVAVAAPGWWARFWGTRPA